jgi:hypothetical protein
LKHQNICLLEIEELRNNFHSNPIHLNMKATLILFPILFAANLFAQTSAFTDVSNSQKEHINSNSKPTVESRSITFIENKGQMHDQNYQPRPDVLFGAMAGNMAFHLKTNGVSYQLTKVDSYKEVEDLKTKEKREEIDQQTIYRIDLHWLNANANFTTSTDNILAGYDNYYTAGCSEGGALNVKSFTGVMVHHLYTGINLHYYEKSGQLKHDYIVAPGADYKKIQLNVKGATVSINEDGSLLLNTPLGKVQEGAPIVYQKGKQLKAKWVVKDQILSFEIENYNPKLELIIDPITRAWGTFYGGGSSDIGYSCATDASANVYMAGRTASSTNMATSGAHQTSYGAGLYDAFLVKFNASGVRQWGTYYGSGGNDMARSCATDASGNVYMAGETSSTLSISTPGAHQSVKNTGFDAFLVKFNSSGIRQWGTYYGSYDDDYGYSCATDLNENVYMAGYTTSAGGMATTGAHQEISDGTDDAFLVKFNSLGVRQWATYYGDLSSEQGNSCTTDASGNVYLAGTTTANTGTAIATTGSHQDSIGGNTDAFLAKFNSNGVRQWGTYYGSPGGEFGNSCTADASGNVFLAGYGSAYTGTFIATAGAHQPTTGGVNDAFLVKFDANGIRQWGTYYGGSFNDYGYACSSDPFGNVYMSGFTASGSASALSTIGAHQTTNGGGASDAFIVKFNSGGVRQYGTYYGGNGDEESWGCAADIYGNFYLAGYAGSIPAVIVTAGAHQTTFGGSIDGFLVKFSDCTASTSTLNETACNSYTWPANGATYTNSGTYTETLVNAAGCDSIISLNLTINTVDNTTSLAGATASANAVGATYQWIDCDNGNIPISGATNQSFTPTVNGNYAVLVTQNGCSAVSNCVSITIVDVREIKPFVGINVYPNPSNGLYTISGITANTNLTVLNSLGEVLYSSIAGGTTESIDLSSLAKGIYFLKLNNKQNESILKISRL